MEPYDPPRRSKGRWIESLSMLRGVNNAELRPRVAEAASFGWSLHGYPYPTYDINSQSAICCQAVSNQIQDAQYGLSMNLFRQQGSVQWLHL